MEMTLRVDTRPIPQLKPAYRYLAVDLMAPAVAPNVERPTIAVAFVIDRSGSMAGGKLRRALRAVELAIRALEPTDFFAIVGYATDVVVVRPMCRATPDNVAAGLAALSDMRAKGRTALFSGWKAGCLEVLRVREDVALGRVLLLTDGQANVGVLPEQMMWEQSAVFREQRVVTSTFGVGLDFEEVLLEGMACFGGGAFYYIERSEQIQSILTRELGERLQTTVSDLRVALQLPSTLRCRLISRFAHTIEGRAFEVAVGDLCADQVVSLVFEFEPVVDFRIGPFNVELTVTSDHRDTALACEQLTWDQASNPADSSAMSHEPLACEVAELLAAQAQQRALRRHRRGDWRQAQAVLRETAAHILAHICAAPALLRIVDALEDDADRFAHDLSEQDRKGMFFDANTRLSSRHLDGRSRIRRRGS